MENIIETIEILSKFLHWLGKYHEANIMAAILRFMRKNQINTLQEFEKALDVEI